MDSWFGTLAGMGSSENWLLVFVVLLIVGGYVILYARLGDSFRVRALRTWNRSRGRVVELRTYGRRPRGGRTPRRWQMPVVEFPLTDGRSFRAESLTGGRPAPVKVGDVVPVLYRPGKPSRMMVITGMVRPGTAPPIVTGLGAALLVIGLIGMGLCHLLA